MNGLINHQLAFSFLFCALIVVSACTEQPSASQTKPNLPEIVDFNFHIKPILSDRCFKCHGPDENTRKADLRFDTEVGALAALVDHQDRYAIVPGHPDSSVIMERLKTDDPDDKMPPPESKLTISDYEVALIEKWIEQGAEWRDHWAYIAPVKAPVPTVADRFLVRNPIDNFIIERLNRAGLQPSPEASRETLIRRLSFDLTGLPPTLAEIDTFLNDDTPNAYENLVERLLAKDAYGERMAVIWLDAARYADTNGYQNDVPRTMWPWRDWVIHAFNTNLPFDKFTRWQLAGDLIPEASLEMILASGFNRNHKITTEGGAIPEEYRVEYVADRTHTTGTVFLGLTMECARCHDHKYDPISQQDYYQMFSFFNNVPERGLIDYGTPVAEPKLRVEWDEITEKLAFIAHRDSNLALEVSVMEELPEPRKCFVLNRGLYDQPTTEVTANVPAFLPELPDSLPRNRLGFAEWLLAEENPLTARVTANRFWQIFFGTGIVGTVDDFGSQGALPSHPELLDWLAVSFRENGWDMKDLIRVIVTSATYRQVSTANETLMEVDPQNILLARGPRYRLPAEMIRDNALFLSDLLVEKVGGASVKPYQPAGLWEEKTAGNGYVKYVQDTGEGLYRKSMYTYWKRTVPPPSMLTFDASTRDVCTVTRQATSTPLQALVLMNDPQLIEAAKFLAVKMIEAGGDSLARRIRHGFRMATSREPDESELEILNDLYESNIAAFRAAPTKAAALLGVGEATIEVPTDSADCAAMTVVANTVLNMYECITKN